MHRLCRVIGMVGVGLCVASCATLQSALYKVLQQPTSSLKIKAADGTWVACDVYDLKRDRVVVISPGFLQYKRSAGIWELSHVLQRDFDVIALDYRGTGESSGTYAYTATEAADLHTVLQFAQRRWAHVGVVGISLGAAIAINELAEHPDGAQSLVTISAPMAFEAIEKRVSPQVSFTAIAEASSLIRSGNPFLTKRDPLEAISHLTLPVLFIHGGQDQVVFPRHSHLLWERARGPTAVLNPDADVTGDGQVNVSDYAVWWAQRGNGY